MPEALASAASSTGMVSPCEAATTRPPGCASMRSVTARIFRPAAQAPSSDWSGGDEAVDGLVGVVLERGVSEVGEDVGLVGDGSGDGAGGAGVEQAASKGGVGDAV